MSNHNSSNTSDVYDDIIEIDAVRYTFVAFYLIASLLAAFGNGYLVFFIIRHRRRTKKNVTAYLILNLAICDLIISLFAPLRMADLLDPTKHGYAEIFCKVGSFLTLTLSCTTFLNIVAISLERLLLICYPLHARSWLTLKNTAKVLVLSWVFSIACALPLPILFTFIVELHLTNSAAQFCLINVFDATGVSGGNVYFIILFVFYYVLPVTTITVSYSMIFRTLHSGFKHGSNVKDDSHQRMQATRKSLAKVMLFIAIGFAVFQGPYFIMFLCFSLNITVTKNPIFLLMAVEFLPLISAALNPIVYSVRTKTFKKSVTYQSHSSFSDQGASLHRRVTERSLVPESTALSRHGSVQQSTNSYDVPAPPGSHLLAGENDDQLVEDRRL